VNLRHLLACASWFAIAGFAFYAPASSQAADREQAWDKTSACFKLPEQSPIVGKCFVVHGRARLSGEGAACTGIWRIGTKRIMHVCDKLPENAEQLLNSGYPEHKMDWIFGNNVFGDFLVCPLAPEKPGVAQQICLARADHLKLVHDR
jgi:hypothetical protein